MSADEQDATPKPPRSYWHSCALPWCQGEAPFVKIPEGGNAILKKPPFNFTTSGRGNLHVEN